MSIASCRRTAHAVSPALFAEAPPGSYYKGDLLDTHLCLELPLLYIRKVTWEWIVPSRERYLWSPREISIWLLREGRGTRWGLCTASSQCLQRGQAAGATRSLSLTETVSAGERDECSVEVDHQLVTEARCGPEKEFNIKKTQRNSSSQGQAHIWPLTKWHRVNWNSCRASHLQVLCSKHLGGGQK